VLTWDDKLPNNKRGKNHVSSCYVLRGMRVRKVSISKRGFQDHSRALAMVPFDRSHTIS